VENEKVKWGFIGTGWIADKFANALKAVDDAQLYAVGSRNLESAKKFADKFGAPKAYGSYEEVALDKDVDVIYIATPHNLHCENTIMCLEHGKNVLCEKPMGVNGNEERKMIAKAKEKNVFLMEALWSRFLPNIIKAKEIVDSGKLGNLKYVLANFMMRSNQTLEGRHFNKELIGGTLMDTGIYNVFLSLLLLGKPQEIKASAGMSVTEIDESMGILFKYPNQTLATMNASFIVESPIIAEIHCEKGKILLPHLWFCPGNVTVVTNDGTETQHSFEFKGNGYDFEVEEVGRCLRANKTQSDLWSWDNSIELIDTLDAIRKQCGIVYPKHD
jgi:scyllo-inositol 2-dehydrogenase (NADP+)